MRGWGWGECEGVGSVSVGCVCEGVGGVSVGCG